MARTQIVTYDVSLGNGTVIIPSASDPLRLNKISYQLTGDAAVDNAVTVKLQESNTEVASSNKDISGATAVANVSTDAYIGVFEFGGNVLSFNVVVGAATVGIITLTIGYK